MKRENFQQVLQGAVAGQHDDLEIILKLYDPLVRKYAFVNGKLDEELYQCLLIHIALNITKFSF